MKKKVSQQKPIIFLPIESTPRELDYKINIARLMCHQGFDTIIGNPPFLRDELRYKNYQGVFLEKGCNPDPDYYKSLSAKGIYLYDLGDEGAASPVYDLNCKPEVDALKLMRRIFLWGETQKKDLIEQNPDKTLEEKYFCLGNPGFDLCDVRYKKFNTTFSIINNSKGYILVNTNFGAIHSFSMDENLKACTLISPQSIIMMEASYEKEAKEWENFQKWLDDIIKSFPHETFVIRPHPCEIEENYKKIFGDYKNVIISKEGNVNYVISSAKLVLHKDCSTALQAYLMDVPAISLGGEELSKSYAQWPLNFSFAPSNLEEAKMMINTIIYKSSSEIDSLKVAIKRKGEPFIARHFSNLGNSTQVLIKAILEDCDELIKNFRPYDFIDSRSYLQKLKLFIRKRLWLHYKVPKASRLTLVKFTKSDIIKRLELLEKCDPTGSSFKVSKIFPNTYKIEKD